MAFKILVVDDEYGIVEVVAAYLNKEGFEVYTSMNGKQALQLIDQVKPDLLILDHMLPDVSGETICETVRLTSDLPILMLTAKEEENDRIQGLTLGADDYMIKPFSPKELVLRVQAILKRVYGVRRVETKPLSFNHGDLIIQVVEKVVYKKNAIIDLTKNEFEILLTFAENPNMTFTREQLIHSAFGTDYEGYDRTVDVYIKNIRKKIETEFKTPEYIVTVYGFGYKFKGERDL